MSSTPKRYRQPGRRGKIRAVSGQDGPTPDLALVEQQLPAYVRVPGAQRTLPNSSPNLLAIAVMMCGVSFVDRRAERPRSVVAGDEPRRDRLDIELPFGGVTSSKVASSSRSTVWPWYTASP
jgi:hypothetical protein